MATTKIAAQPELQKAGHLAARCQWEVATRLAPGVTTLEIDQFIERGHSDEPSCFSCRQLSTT